MNDKKLRDHLVDYYRDTSLRRDTEERMIEMARGHEPGKESTMQILGRGFLLGIPAAAVVVLALLGFNAARETTESGSAANTTGETAVSSVWEAPNLVAVKIHAAWCARSPVVEPIFTDLTEKYGNQPILFVTLDITDDVLRKQSSLLASNLGIEESAFEAPFESGMVKLIDRSQGNVLAILTEEAQAPAMEWALAQALPDVEASSSR